MKAAPFFSQLITAQKRGQARGITSICSAHPLVIEASFRHALAQANAMPVLIESTCNQVNQFGGYTGMRPVGFVAYVRQIADRVGFPRERLLLGGDHLGPSPWQHEPAAPAMAKAMTLVEEYVRAGYQKIHLDASMKCGDDDPTQPLAMEISAARTATLAAAAEATLATQRTAQSGPVYVIGTEVPTPGGALAPEEQITVTAPGDVAETIAITRAAFQDRKLDAAWQRVIAVVVQPGVEFGDATIFEYDAAAARPLVRLIEEEPQLVYEAHSTDYQTAVALAQMVADHFAILKVGPALTFALREAIFALAMMEEALPAGRRVSTYSNVRTVLDDAMLANPSHWRSHYPGATQAQALARQYSFSDRSRYYWPVPIVEQAVSRLMQNLAAQPLPLALLSQYAPDEYRAIRAGLIPNTPHAVILHRIGAILADYSAACSPK